MIPLLIQLVVAAPPRIAVLDVQAHADVSASLVQGVTEDVVLEVHKQAVGATVIGMNEIRTMIGVQRQKALLGCSEAACLAEIGGALGVQKLVSGALNHFGNVYLLVIKLIDARSAKVLKESSVRFTGVEEILDVVPGAIADLFPPTGTTTPAIDKEKVFVPQPSHTLPIVLASAGVAFLGAGIAFLAVGATTSVPSSGPFDAANGTKTQASNFEIVSLVLGIAAVGLGTTAVIAW